MMTNLEQRVLILAPTPKDAEMTCDLFDTVGLTCHVCNSLTELCQELDRGAGTVMVPEEAIIPGQNDCLREWLDREPPWSDLPVLVLARLGADSAVVGQAMDLLGNVTVLERPIRSAALVSTVRAALRARQRQYQNRDHIVERERSELEMRDFFDKASVGLHWLDADGVILRVNQNELNMLGYTREEYVGRRIAEFHVDAERVADMHRRLTAGEPIADYEARLRCKNGSVKDVLIDCSSLWEEGRFVHTRCFTRDITDRKRAEEGLREADRRKDEFLAILAHELRNPLAPIRNALHVLRLDVPKDSPAARASEMIERQVNHMVRLVDDLLEVSRITQGKIELRREQLDVESVVLHAVDMSAPHIDAAGHTLLVSIPPEPLALEGDPVRLAQVFSNLLNNAAKYTDRGGKIWLTVRRDQGMARISVRDTGAGIPDKMLPRVFEMFTQVDRSTSRTQGGLGIGLTLVKSLVEMHGGSVEAHSAGHGRGSEFVVNLPLLEAAPADSSPRMEEPSKAISHRVLVCDDNHDSAESLGMLLELLGADTRVVYSGAELLEVIDSYRPSAVLMDIGMPGMDGYEVARRIRQRPNLQNVKLIALTGWGQEEDRRRSQLAGFDYHLVKPADLRKLETVLVEVGQS